MEEKIVFRLSRAVWRERSSAREGLEEGERDGRGERGEESLQKGLRGEERVSPTLRKRSFPNKSSLFNPSGCNQCGSTITCNSCIRRKEQELQAIKKKYDAIKASYTHKIRPKEEVKPTITPANDKTNSLPPKPKLKTAAIKTVALKTAAVKTAAVKTAAVKTASVEAAKPAKKRGRPRSTSESVPTSEEAVKQLDNIKSSIPCEVLDKHLAVREHELFSTAVNSLTYESVIRHLKSLRIEYIQKLLRPVLQSLMLNPRNNDIFNYPVDPEALGLKDYFLKVPNPMDLGTVKSRLLRGHYQTILSCADDVNLVFRNATAFNPVQHIVHQAAVFLNNVFIEEMKSVQEKHAKDDERRKTHSCDRCDGRSCSFCGEKCLKLEPPIIVCHGQCGQRIKRLGIYYVSTDGSLIYCQKCYTTCGPVVSGGDTPTTRSSPVGLSPACKDDTSSNRMGPFTPTSQNNTPRDGSRTPKPLLKRDMLKRRFDEELYEPWIKCNSCPRKVHQVCALYNPFYERDSECDITHSSKVSSDQDELNCDAVVKVEGGGSPRELPANKMVTRKRGRHKKGTHLHLFQNRKRSSSISPSSDEDGTDNTGVIFLCAMCKLHAASSKFKRGKRGPKGLTCDNKVAAKKPKRENLELVPMVNPSSPTMDIDANDSKCHLQSAMLMKKSADSSHGTSVENEHSCDIIEAKEDVTGLDVHMDESVNHESNNNIEVTLAGEDTWENEMDIEDNMDDKVGFKEENYDLLSQSGHPVESCEKGRSDIDHIGSSGTCSSSTVGLLQHQLDIKVEKPENCSTSELCGTTVCHTNVSIDTESRSCPQQQASSPVVKVEDSGVADEALRQHTWRASSLPTTKLSDFIEAMVRNRLCQLEPATSTKNDINQATSCKSEYLNGDNIMDTLTIRVVANASRSMDVPDIISDNLPTAEGNRVPPYFVYRQKCILLFQKIDGIDVCLFCLYVQEFDESCPEPNKSRVYIAYLDSVEYFRPRQLRTQVYHEIIISYLKWAQARGFKFGHIWACPPQRGDNFIFWCHPSQQRTPSRDRLTSWYNSMLSRAKDLGICASVNNLWTSFFEGYGKREDGLQRQASKNSYVGRQHLSVKSSKQSKKSATSSNSKTVTKDEPKGDEVPVCPPVFEGDFWVNECTRVYKMVHSRTQGIRYDRDKSLNQRKCRETLKSLMTKPIAYCFNQPVDPVALNIPDYPSIITSPMDFGTVRDKLRSNSYRSMLDFANDVRLTCKNAMTYNPPAHVIHSYAKELLGEFEKTLTDMVTDRVGEIFASANDVDTWLATYPVNSAMEKEEKKKRAKELQKQRLLIADQKTAAVLDVGSRNGSPGVECGSSPMHLCAHQNSEKEAMSTVNNVMNVDESDERFLNTLHESSENHVVPGALSSVTAESPQSTLCTTRRVFFPPEDRVASCSSPIRESSCLDNDEYGFVDYESCISDGDSRAPYSVNKTEDDSGNSECELNDNCDVGGGVSSFSGAQNYPSDVSCNDLDQKYTPSDVDSDYSMHGISRQSSMDSVMSVTENWPRRPDRTSSVCVEESMELSSSLAVTQMLHSPPQSDLSPSNGRLSIDISATRAVSTKLAINSVRRKNRLNANLPFDKPQLGIKGSQALMSELSKNVFRLKDDMYVLTFSSPSSLSGELSGENPPSWNTDISESCSLMLRGITPDTSDPDPVIRSPFIESRQTFLEMSQFRHLQFDSLRRAKYSSSLLIFHFLFPQIPSTRPHCEECTRPIRKVRWHCDSCHENYDICNSCKYSERRKPHEHEDSLTPVRVTYV